MGQTLVDKLADLGADVVRIFDNNEPSLAATQTTFGNGQFRYLSGDVRDKDRLERAMQDINIVLHTAAMKHVDIAEYSPFEA